MLDYFKLKSGRHSGVLSAQALEQVRELIEQAQTEKALDELGRILKCRACGETDTLILLKNRFREIQNETRQRTITWDVAAAEKSKIEKSLLDLIKQLERPALTILSAEQETRTDYLENVKEDIENRLKVSIHNARFIDLGIDPAPTATHLPWVYKDPYSSQEFSNIEEAFAFHKGRLLILGRPGAGKSTSLLHIAQQLIAAAQTDQGAPLPVLVNLSQFHPESKPPPILSRFRKRDSRSEERDDRLERWIIGKLTERPGVSNEVARRWVEEDRIAVLFDGLDEVDDEYRADLVRLLNTTFLSDHPGIIAIVCSRINEYLPLQDAKETRLQLRGAVTLQPLSKAKIEEYLDAAKATRLREALPNDAALYEMAQTPLTLSMMTLAYGGLVPSDISMNQYRSLAERRHQLMATYVERMLQRKERRDRDIPFDLSADNDVPEREYAYTPEQVHRYLGWLAVRLSIRMQNAFSLDQFFGFLKSQLKREQQPTVASWIALAQGLTAFLSVLAVGSVLMPMSLSGFLGVVLIGTLGTLLNSWAPGATEMRWRGWVKGRIAVIAAVAVTVIGLGAGSRALAAVVPWQVSAYSMGLIAIGVVMGLIAIGVVVALALGACVAEPDNDFRAQLLWLIALTVVSFPLSMGLARILDFPEATDLVLVALLVASQGTLLALIAAKDSGWEGAWRVVALVPTLVALHSLGVWIVGSLDWYEALTVVAGVAFTLSHVDEDKALAALIALILLTMGGGLVAGAVGATLGVFVFLIMLLLYFLAFERTSSLTRASGLLDWIGDGLGSWLKRVGERFLSPIVLKFAFLTFRLPFRCRSFIDYATNALLLKHSAGDVEFMHRLLRDYFALRDLLPLLYETNSDRRLETIRSLGFQGESAVDSLAELARDRDPQVREAAVLAFGRIASPQVPLFIEAALSDREPIVRRAAVEVLRNLRGVDFARLVGLLSEERAIEVNLALLSVLSTANLPEGFVSRMIASCLSNSPESKELLRAVVRRANDGWRWVIPQVVERFPSWADRYLPELLSDDDAQIRSGSLMTLALTHKREYVGRITRVLEQDAHEEVRSIAAQALGELRDEQALEPLLQALADRHESVRNAAAKSVGQLGIRQAVGPMIEALLKRKRCLQRAAAKGLGGLGDLRAVEPLIRALASWNAGVREAAAYALGQLGDARAVEPLIHALDDRWSEGVREAAAEALGQLGDARAVEPLIRALASWNAGVRKAAAGVLGRLGDARAVEPLIHALDDRWSEGVREAAAYALGQLGDARAVEPLIHALDDRWSKHVREAAAEALGELGDARAVEPLIHAMADQSEHVHVAAAYALGRLGDPRAVEPLIHAMADHRWSANTVRLGWAAKRSLCRFGDARAVEPLIRALAFWDAFWDADVRGAAAEALGRLGDARAVEPLIHALADQSEHVREAAAEALGRLGDARAVEPLIHALADQSAGVRGAAAEALGRLGDARGVDPLVLDLADQSEHVRKAAAEALGQLGDARAVEPLIHTLADQSANARKAAAEALGRLGDARGVDPLIFALADQSEHVRKAAAEALGQLGDARAVEPLIHALDDRWSKDVRKAAAEALGRLGDARGVEPLIHALDDRWSEHVRKAAAEALGRLGDARGVEPLIHALDDRWSEHVRKAAAEALGRLGDARGVEPLIHALDDRWSEHVRKAAAEALGRLGDARAVEPLTELLERDLIPFVHDACAEAIRKIDPPAVKGHH